jgi:hypothetical protein
MRAAVYTEMINEDSNRTFVPYDLDEEHSVSDAPSARDGRSADVLTTNRLMALVLVPFVIAVLVVISLPFMLTARDNLTPNLRNGITSNAAELHNLHVKFFPRGSNLVDLDLPVTGEAEQERSLSDHDDELTYDSIMNKLAVSYWASPADTRMYDNEENEYADPTYAYYYHQSYVYGAYYAYGTGSELETWTSDSNT